MKHAPKMIKPITTFHRLCIYLVALFIVVMPAQGLAQFLPGTLSDDGQPAGANQALIEEAQKNGATIYVITPPGTDEADEVAEDGSMRAERFLQVRQRAKEVIGSSANLWENLKGTIANASADGSNFWILQAIGTAVLGLALGIFLNQPVARWMREHFRGMYEKVPDTNADRMKYLLFRAFLAFTNTFLRVFTAFVVAIVLDPGIEPARRIIFEIIMAFAVYNIMRRTISWNLFAHDLPNHRMVNLTDEEATRIHRDWHISVGFGVIVAAIARFFGITGDEQLAAGMAGGLTIENVMFLQMTVAATMILIATILTLKDWKVWQKMFAPFYESDWMYGPRKTIAGLVPFFWLLYGFFAFGAFVFKLMLGEPAPAMVIAAPYLALWGGFVAYAISMILIQLYYDRRQRMFDEKVAAAKAELEAAEAKVDTDSGEEMVVASDPTVFEYQPAFRGFFENSAVAIIAVFALGEIGRAWGIEVTDEESLWASLLDIFLIVLLCWLAYRAFSIFIDRRMEEEGGVPAASAEEEMGGEGGGAGATRMATLLPIFRYVMIIVVFSVAGMVTLSKLGFDIAPIFAGAGVVGIAVGFGAQTLIRDIFSGAFFLMDDAFRKGEYVEIENIRGTVEKISIRSFQLRHHLGALHTIPFGEIRQLTNYSRDWVLMKLPLRVTYDTDVEKVRKLVKKLGQALLEHPQVGHTFMQPLKSQGVYKMEDSAMIIRVKFMTKPGEQFVTRKVVYESIQDLFAREGVHFAHKEVTVRLADQSADSLTEAEKQAVASAARRVIDADEEAALAAAGGKKSDNGR